MTELATVNSVSYLSREKFIEQAFYYKIQSYIFIHYKTWRGSQAIAGKNGEGQGYCQYRFLDLVVIISFLWTLHNFINVLRRLSVFR